MKLKALGVLALSGCLAASFLYASPALADDDLDSDEPLQFLADNNTSQPDANNLNNGMDANTSNSPANMSQNNATNNNNIGSDAGAPDTATGDDDY